MSEHSSSTPGTAPFGPVLARVTALSVEESARRVASGDVDDPLVALAIGAAAGHELLAAAADKPKAAESVARYLARMGGRATPYGLLAGTALVEVGPDRALTLAQPAGHLVRTRVDAAALEEAVAAAFAAAPVAQWPLQVNPLARLEGPLLRFARPGDASAAVVAVQATPVIRQVLQLLEDRVLSADELAAELQAWRPALAAEQVLPLVLRLLDSGLLERATGLVRPGVEPATLAVAALERAGADEQAAALRRLLAETGGTAPLSPDLGERWERSWARAAEVLPAFAEVAEGRRYDHQLELGLTEARLDTQTVDDLVGALSRVQEINATGRGDDAGGDASGAPELDLGRFRDAFRARYEDAEVPLLAAVDLESGVLQPARRRVSQLARAAGITADDLPVSARVPSGVLTAYQRFTWSAGPVDISDLPPAATLTSRALMAVLLDDHEGRHSALLVGGLGRSPFAMMARFALGRPAVEAAFAAQIAQERSRPTAPGDDPDPIRAELVYAPGGRIDNVLLRPRIYDETIGLTGAAGGTLGLDRLTLRLDGDTFALRDTVTGRPVVVELNTAHNADFAGQDPVYAVLGRLAGGGGAGWSWGGLQRLDHLPRVTCGRVIIAAEQWQLGAAELASVRAATDPGSALRRAIGLTDDRRWLGLGHLDQILPLDLGSARSVRAALARTPGRNGVRLVEMPQAEAPAAAGPRGRHVTEVVVGLGRALRPARRPAPVDIVYCPLRGARWVYARFHCGQSSAEQVVARSADLAGRLRAAGQVEEWFYVRYLDDGYHVRVRLQAASGARDHVLAAVSALGAALRSEGLVGRISLDDYVPEIGRYGGARTLELAERVFTASSTDVAAFLGERPAEEGRLFRAVADTLAWSEVLFDDPADRLPFLQGCQRGLRLRFARTGNPHGKLLRQHRDGLQAYLERYRPDPVLLEAVRTLAAAVRTGPGPERLLQVLGSCLHMHCNRIFAFDPVRLEYLSHEWAIRKTRERGARLLEPVPADGVALVGEQVRL